MDSGGLGDEIIDEKLTHIQSHICAIIFSLVLASNFLFGPSCVLHFKENQIHINELLRVRVGVRADERSLT